MTAVRTLDKPVPAVPAVADVARRLHRLAESAGRLVAWLSDSEATLDRTRRFRTIELADRIRMFEQRWVASREFLPQRACRIIDSAIQCVRSEIREEGGRAIELGVAFVDHLRLIDDLCRLYAADADSGVLHVDLCPKDREWRKRQ